MKSLKAIQHKSDRFQEAKLERSTSIKLDKSVKKAEKQLEQAFRVEVKQDGKVFEINHNGRIIRNSNKLEALKDLGTITGYYYGKTN